MTASNRLRLAWILAPAAVAVAGCTDSTPSAERESPASRTDVPSPIDLLDWGPDLPPQPPGPAVILDPTARPGERFGALVVLENALHPGSGAERGWVGSVRFEGDLTLRGEIRPHPADEESRDICFFPDAASARLLPRLAGDERTSWFCFTNPSEARRLLPDDAERRRLTITIADFRYAYSFSDVHNEARLVESVTYPIAGCYEMTRGAWDIPETSSAVRPEPPTEFALLDSLGDRGLERGQRLARPTLAAPGAQDSYGFWIPLGRDSVRVVWTNGYVGVRLDVAPTSRGLEGVALAFSDAASATGEWPEAAAAAERTECGG